MPQAAIMINGTVGSNDDLPINTIVQFDNQNQGGELTFNWSIIDQPPGAPDVLSSLIAKNPTFTPKKEGTYLIRLVVNAGMDTQEVDEQIVGVRQLKTRERVPAFTETIQDGGGWNSAADSWLRRVDRMSADPGVMVGVNASGGPLARGTLVQINAETIIKTGLPGQEPLPNYLVADGSAGFASYRQFDQPILIVEGTVDGGVGPVPAGALMRARLFGPFYGLSVPSGPAVAVPLYPNNGVGSGQLVELGDVTVSLLQRQLAIVIASPGGPVVDVWYQGVGRMPEAQMIVFGNGSTPAVGGSTVFLTPYFEKDVAPATEAGVPIFQPGVIASMLINARVATAGAALTLTARKNGIDTVGSAVLAAGATQGFNVGFQAFKVAFGDVLSMKCVAGGGIAAGATDIYAVAMYLPTALF